MINKRFFTIIFTATCLLLFVLCVVIIVQRKDKIAIEVSSAPSSAEIFIDNKKVESGIIYLPPGQYIFTGKENGYRETSAKVLVERGKSLKVLLPLTPLNDQKNNSANTKKLDNYQLESLRQERKKVEEENPIAKKLPLRNLIYTVGYRADPDRKHGIIVEIDAPRGYKNGAIHAIEKEGFNPTRYNIRFRQYANPFQEIKHE